MKHGSRCASIVLGGLVATALWPGPGHGAEETAPMRLGRGGAVQVAGREVRCGNVRTRLDRSLPNLGAAAPDSNLMVLNPSLMRRFSGPVQLFVFHHECGHHHVGASELEADCWAVGEGVRTGWLDRNGLGQVCRSFGNAPETDTHPSGKRRCANIDRCFAKVETEVAKSKAAPPATPATPAPATPVSAPVRTAKAAPRLLAGPRLVRSSVTR